ncbi:MAG: hypothetical protein KJ623_00225 [Nanoarchaeota archaeon]|nr:hypothetical protein [Nanoarchaeota archaeon]MBU0963208.1 hypothetical protein [Nanoarchaeota archaeon]
MGKFRSEDRGRPRNRSSNRFGDRPREFEERGRFRDRDSGRSERRPVEMHNVICDKCGKECEVPFKPTEGKPVYCNECFRSNDDSRGRPQSGGSSEQLSKINAKLDKILKILESDSDDDSEKDLDEE